MHSEIRTSPEKISWVIVECSVLHNLAIDLNKPFHDDWDVDVDTNEEEIKGLDVPPTGNAIKKEA